MCGVISGETYSCQTCLMLSEGDVCWITASVLYPAGCEEAILCSQSRESQPFCAPSCCSTPSTLYSRLLTRHSRIYGKSKRIHLNKEKCCWWGTGISDVSSNPGKSSICVQEFAACLWLPSGARLRRRCDSERVKSPVSYHTREKEEKEERC